MSDAVKHECAVALLRLRKPQEYYFSKYGSADYGFSKMALLLEKQHNRGQDGAGIASLYLNPEPGLPAYRVERSAASEDPLADLLGRGAGAPGFDGGLLLGHLRYATYGRDEESACHPFVHDSNCLRRTLLLAGNFNRERTLRKVSASGAPSEEPRGRLSDPPDHRALPGTGLQSSPRFAGLGKDSPTGIERP